MKPLLTDAQRIELLANGAKQRACIARCQTLDPVPVVKLFTPDGKATWLLSELDPDDADMAFGLCDLGIGFPELDFVRLSDLESVRGPKGLPIERDLHFVARHPLSEYAKRARLDGSIND